jgi:RNA polymerase sigma-70 factor (ECF subfamily)
MINSLKYNRQEQQDTMELNLRNFEDFYNEYFPKIYNYVRYRVNNPDEADDLTSKIFERALTNIQRFNFEKGTFSTWLFAIANNIMIDYFKSNAKNPKVPFDLLSNAISGAKSPEHKIIAREQRKNLLTALEELDTEKRNLIALKFWGELKNRQIAEITGLSESNVGVTLYRTLKQLKTILDKRGVDLHE